MMSQFDQNGTEEPASSFCDSDVSEYSIDGDDSSDESMDELRDDFSEEDSELEEDSSHLLDFIN